MADYKNCTCIACRNEFEPDDDIVVCPDCGTPYHRDCWNAHGHCINTELHETGKAWARPAPGPEESKASSGSALVPCPNCGSKNDESNLFCTRCGSSMRRGEEGRAPFGGFSGMFQSSEGGEEGADWREHIPGMGTARPDCPPDEELEEGVRMQDAVDFVGKNTLYHIPRFRFFRDQKKKLAPNFVCLLFPEFYYAYRKMWPMAILTLFVTFLLSIPGVLLSLSYQSDLLLAMMQPENGAAITFYGMDAADITAFAEFVETHYNAISWADSICSYVTLVMHILTFLFSNYLYYRHSLKRIKAVRADQKSLMDVQSRIRMAGGAHFGYVILAFAAETVLTMLLILLL